MRVECALVPDSVGEHESQSMEAEAEIKRVFVGEGKLEVVFTGKKTIFPSSRSLLGFQYAVCGRTHTVPQGRRK